MIACSRLLFNASARRATPRLSHPELATGSFFRLRPQLELVDRECHQCCDDSDATSNGRRSDIASASCIRDEESPMKKLTPWPRRHQQRVLLWRATNAATMSAASPEPLPLIVVAKLKITGGKNLSQTPTATNALTRQQPLSAEVAPQSENVAVVSFCVTTR